LEAAILYLFHCSRVDVASTAHVGSNIREVRTKLSLTQAQLAAPEFSISYISAIERGKIRPSLKALFILAKCLDVPLTFLLEGSPGGTAEARAVGYSPADSGPDQRIDVELLQASVLLQQHLYTKASELLTPILPDRITTDQAYQLSCRAAKFIWAWANIRRPSSISAQPSHMARIWALSNILSAPAIC
jgi:transcriptional regulator with XRE-family HTH domain